MFNHRTLQVVASSQGPAPYGYPSAHQLPNSLNSSLQPDKVSGYSSLAAWHGGNPPAYPPRGQPAPSLQVHWQVSQPPAHQPLPQQSPSGSLPSPNGIHELLGPPPAMVSRHHPYISSSAAAGSSSSPKPTKKRARGPTPSTQLQWITYSPSESTGQAWPPTTPSTCVCGASFNAPRERERHWRAFKCGSSAPQANVDLLVIPGKYDDQKAHEVDKKWLAVLLKAFEENPYPAKEVRAELAWKMRVPRYAVDNWFWWEREAREM